MNRSNWLVFIIILTTLAVYSPVLWFDFINYDDPFFVTMNENVRHGLSWDSIRWAFITPYEANWIPLSWISHMLDVQLFGLNPGGHHIVNVVLHASSTFLLFCFLNRSTGDRWKSGMVAFLFALHPLHVESVAWVSERKDVLSGFFWMLTLCAYADYVRKPGFLRYSVCLASFVLGLLAKPMLVTLPLILLLLDLWPLSRLGLKGERPEYSRLPRLVLEKVPFAIFAIAECVITYISQKAGGTVTESYTFASRAGKACTYYVAYLGKMLWPTDLTIFYPLSLYPPSSVKVVAAALFLTVVTISVICFRNRNQYLLTGWLWFLVTLMPVIGLVQIGGHSIADRYTYIPLVGVFILLVWGIPALIPERDKIKVILRGAVLLLMISLVIVTSRQLSHWNNSITLFGHAVEVTPWNHVAHNNLGYALLEDGKVDESITHFQQAVEQRPADTFAWINLGDAYSLKRDYEMSRDAYQKAVMYDPQSEKGHFGLGMACANTNRHECVLEEYAILQRMGSPLVQELMREIMNRGIGITPVKAGVGPR